MMHVLGEELSERELTEMLRSGDGDPHTKAQSITHQQLIKLLPPLCPSRVRLLGVRLEIRLGVRQSLMPDESSASTCSSPVVRSLDHLRCSDFGPNPSPSTTAPALP